MTSEIQKKTKKSLTSGEMTELLRQKWQPPEWITMVEVRNKVGFTGSPERYADLLAMSTYPGRGIRLIGCELKSSRSDLLSELANPETARAIEQYCHSWYVVLGRKDLATPDEIPPLWGILAPSSSGDSLRKVRAATEKEPAPWPHSFVASMLRRAFQQSGFEDAKRQLEEAEAEAFKNGFDAGKGVVEKQESILSKELSRLKGHVSEFQRETGFQIRWASNGEGKVFAGLYRAFRTNGVFGYGEQIDRVLESIRSSKQVLLKAKKALEEVT